LRRLFVMEVQTPAMPVLGVTAQSERALDGPAGPEPSWTSARGSAPFRFLIRDRDGKFTAAFDDVFSGNGTQVIRTPVRSPRANSFAERYVGTLRRECLDHLLIHGERHLRTVLAEFESHYNHHRPHRSRSLHPPVHNPGKATDMTARINCRTTIGGLINEYHRAA
jgi:hypothetical protein